jgi:hypothetical protein
MKLEPPPQPVKNLSVARSRAMGESSMVLVISGGTCIGFLLKRGREGIAAHDSNERLLGLFSDVLAAAAAVERSAAPASPGDGGSR